MASRETFENLVACDQFHTTRLQGGRELFVKLEKPMRIRCFGSLVNALSLRTGKFRLFKPGHIVEIHLRPWQV